MSRIIRPPVEDGQAVTATDLNTRFTDFSQPNALNLFNTRDAAFDLPQFSSTRFMAPDMATAIIGYNDWKHTAYNTDTAPVGASAPFLVRNAAGIYTPLSFGPAGWTLTSDYIFRVYWDLSVRPRYEGVRPWTTAGSLSFWNIGAGVAGPSIATNVTCWAFWLQWDITSNALANWTNVPFQGQFNSGVIGNQIGEPLGSTMATTVVPAFNETGSCNNGGFDGRLEALIGWTGISGDWHHTVAPNAPITIYGLRLAFTGLLHSYNNGGLNYLVRDDALNAAGAMQIDHNGGSLEAMRLRVS